MIAIASIVVGFGAGSLVRDLPRAYAVWLPIWWIALVVQTLTVIRDEDTLEYWLVASSILVLGVAMVWIGARVRVKRVTTSRR